MEEIDGMSAARISAMKKFFKSKKKYGSPIMDIEIGASSPIWSATEFSQDLCRIAHKTYSFHHTPLYFVPLRNDVRNAYAFHIEGFDVISITDTLIKSIDDFTFFFARYIENILNKIQPGGGSSRSSFGVLLSLEGDLRKNIDIFGGMLRDGVLAFLIGHELGHLAGGHLGVFGKYNTAANFAENTSYSEWDEALANVNINEQGELALSSRILVSHEVDADLQGMNFLAQHWCDILKNNELSLEEKSVYSALLYTTPLRYIMSLTCIGIAFLLLGVKSFEYPWQDQASHPLEATRLLIAMKSLSNFFPDSNGPELIKAQAFESFTFVHAAWGQALIQNKPVTNQFTGRDVAIFNLLRTKSKEQRHKFLFGSTGLTSMFKAIGEMDPFLEELSNIYASEEGLRMPGRRTRAEKMVRW